VGKLARALCMPTKPSTERVEDLSFFSPEVRQEAACRICRRLALTAEMDDGAVLAALEMHEPLVARIWQFTQYTLLAEHYQRKKYCAIGDETTALALERESSDDELDEIEDRISSAQRLANLWAEGNLAQRAAIALLIEIMERRARGETHLPNVIRQRLKRARKRTGWALDIHWL